MTLLQCRSMKYTRLTLNADKLGLPQAATAQAEPQQLGVAAHQELHRTRGPQPMAGYTAQQLEGRSTLRGEQHVRATAGWWQTLKCLEATSDGRQRPCLQALLLLLCGEVCSPPESNDVHLESTGDASTLLADAPIPHNAHSLASARQRTLMFWIMMTCMRRAHPSCTGSTGRWTRACAAWLQERGTKLVAGSRLRFPVQSSCLSLRVSRALPSQPLCRLPAVAEQLPLTVFKQRVRHWCQISFGTGHAAVPETCEM